MKKKIWFIYGTRPEAIKMAPLIHEFKKSSEYFDCKVCLTGQHPELLIPFHSFFEIHADFELTNMKPKRDLTDITCSVLQGLRDLYQKYRPDLVFVQGDTTSAMAGALAAFYQKIPIAHLEAGLRTNEIHSPYPEEVNRCIISSLASLNFAPTFHAVQNLERSNVSGKTYLVGNTITDALLFCLRKIKEFGEDDIERKFSYLDFNKKIVLVTCHRRENWANGIESLAKAIAFVAQHDDSVQFVWPLHPNPDITEKVVGICGNIKNIHVKDAFDYPSLVWLMTQCCFILTDSGGIQEEAPSLGKKVFVLREHTERQEGIENGFVTLIGTDKTIIINMLKMALKKPIENTQKQNFYGDGFVSARIEKLVRRFLGVS